MIDTTYQQNSFIESLFINQYERINIKTSICSVTFKTFDEHDNSKLAKANGNIKKFI